MEVIREIIFISRYFVDLTIDFSSFFGTFFLLFIERYFFLIFLKLSDDFSYLRPKM